MIVPLIPTADFWEGHAFPPMLMVMPDQNIPYKFCDLMSLATFAVLRAELRVWEIDDIHGQGILEVARPTNFDSKF